MCVDSCRDSWPAKRPRHEQVDRPQIRYATFLVADEADRSGRRLVSDDKFHLTKRRASSPLNMDGSLPAVHPEKLFLRLQSSVTGYFFALNYFVIFADFHFYHVLCSSRFLLFFVFMRVIYCRLFLGTVTPNGAASI